ncbi:MAG: type 2a secretion system protein GspN [Idiomarinaceae bacterium HL-53]|nr:MAG: type 2a secretion system protein GspN [Idiomarinaceae bacterium HL-53]CUS47250.1 general secretion pathway protein N [Idiomarinaceae bacterium HL-53]
MKLKLIIWLGVVYFIALMVMFPARLAVKIAPLPADVRLEQVTGTLWHPQFGSIGMAERSLQAVSVELFPLALFTGKLAAQVQVGRHELNPFSLDGHVTYSFGGASLEDWIVRGDLGKASRWLDIPNLVPVQGEFTLELTEYQQGQQLCNTLSARGTAFDVRTRVGDVWHPIGDYDVSLSCREGSVVVEMPENNLLGIEFELQLTDVGYKLAGSLRPSANSPQAIRDILRVVGTPNAQGRYLFSLERP